MQVTIRKSKNNVWGFVESFSEYFYEGKGTIQTVVGITPEGKMTTPYVLRGSEFIPLKQIEEEMGIEKYIKAKKPFYSLLSDGFIAMIKTGVDYETGEYLPEKSSFIIYKVKDKRLTSPSQGELELVRSLEIPDAVVKLIDSISREIAPCKGNKAVFLRNRM